MPTINIDARARHNVNISDVGNLGGNFRRVSEAVIAHFDSVIQDKARWFSGRTEVFEKIEAFRASHDRGYFEVLADSGLGKTALAAEFTRRTNAFAFFTSASFGYTRPDQFLTHICASIIERHHLPFEYLPERASQDTDFLFDLLNSIHPTSAPIWIVVDALDEAERPKGASNPLLLPPSLPEGVYVLVTRRPESGAFLTDSAPLQSYTIEAAAKEQQADIEAYIQARIRDDQQVAARLAQIGIAADLPGFVARLRTASDGNFMYLGYIFDEIAGSGADAAASQALLTRVNALPQGLNGYYERFWEGAEAAAGKEEWRCLHRPVLEHLAAAAEPVSIAWLEFQVERNAGSILQDVLRPDRRFLSMVQEDGQEFWRVVHASFAEFLSRKGGLSAVHRSIAEHYLDLDDFADWDAYGLRNVPAHLAAAAGQKPARPGAATTARKLSDLMLGPAFEAEYLKRLRAPDRFDAALQLALRTLAEDDRTPPDRAAAMALRLVDFRQVQQRAAAIFELAQQGRIEAALGTLALFASETDDAWQEALRLFVVWLAADHNPDGARTLRDGLRQAWATNPPNQMLVLLRARVDAAIEGTPRPALFLPWPPQRYEAQAIVDSLGTSGADVNASLRNEMINLDQGGGFLAAADGPKLIAFAAESPEPGNDLLKQYLDLHSAYGYREYRQGSLAALLPSVLNHPDDAWVRSWLPAIGAAVLAPNRGDFRFCFGFAVDALSARTGDAAALQRLVQGFRKAMDTATNFISEYPMPNTVMAGQREPTDTWAFGRRWCAGVVEAGQALRGDPNEISLGASEMVLARALTLRPGLAGFSAPANLTLAEAVEIAAAAGWIAPVVPVEFAGKSPEALIQAALDSALAGAHKVIDPRFCARTTARVVAMRDTWWAPTPAAAEVADAIERLVADPSDPEFATRHLIGERYELRNPTPATELPPEMLFAETLNELADVYRRPLDQFLRLNRDRGWGANDRLPEATEVRVPDPGFAPLLAARLAGRALVDPSIEPEVRGPMIRRLVPVAAANATCLDTVLGRLVLAAGRLPAGVLEALGTLADRHRPQQAN